MSPKRIREFGPAQGHVLVIPLSAEQGRLAARFYASLVGESERQAILKALEKYDTDPIESAPAQTGDPLPQPGS